MSIKEEDNLYDPEYSVENSQVDSRRLIIYDFPVTLNQNGIYNILEHIECPPTNIILFEKSDDTGVGEKSDSIVSSKTGFMAIVEFTSKALVDKAFYILTTQYKKVCDAQYAYRCKPSGGY